MIAAELMSKLVTCCTRETPLKIVAQMMNDRDCGAIPVVDNKTSLKPLGIVSDRDIACRAVAKGKTPLQAVAAECMTVPVVTVGTETSTDDCCRLMQQHQIRRLVVVDQSGACVGLIALADLAWRLDDEHVARVLRSVSNSPVGVNR